MKNATSTSELLPDEPIPPATRPENGSRPDPQWIRGKCPEYAKKGIDEDLVSNLYYVGGKGYLVRWECWGSLSEAPTCDYRMVL